MLSVNKLEKIIELEEKLRAEYQGQLEKKTAAIEHYAARQAELEASVEQQLETIKELSGKATANQRIEQLNRELSNRSEKLQEDVTDLKKRAKSLQRDLAEVREENKALKQFDPARMKKNLDAGKRKLAEKTRANELLQKALNKAKSENAELQHKLQALEEKLGEQDADAADKGAEEQAA